MTEKMAWRVRVVMLGGIWGSLRSAKRRGPAPHWISVVCARSMQSCVSQDVVNRINESTVTQELLVRCMKRRKQTREKDKGMYLYIERDAERER